MFESDVPIETRILVDNYYDSDEVSKGHREMIIDIDHTKLGQIKNLNFPIKFSDTKSKTKLPPPLLGEHNDQILKDLGYSDKDIEDPRSENIITS